MAKFVTNDQIAAEEEAKVLRARELQAQQDGKLSDLFKSDLAAHIQSAWQQASWEKTKFQDQMIANLLQKNGEYDPQKKAEITELGSDIFMLITAVKCRTALYLLRQIFNQPGEKCWTINPTPLPSLNPEDEKIAEITFTNEVQNAMMQMEMAGQVGPNPEMMRQTMMKALPQFKEDFKQIILDIAKEKAKAMEKKMDDQLTEGGYYEAILECMADLVDLKAGFIKKDYAKKKIPSIVPDPVTGKGRVEWKEEIIPVWSSPSPFDIFPAPGSTGINDGSLIERIHYLRTNLQDMIGLPGFDESALREILENFESKGIQQWTLNEQERIEAEGRESAQYYSWDKIAALEYHGAVPGRMLIAWAGANNEDGTLSERRSKIERILGKEIDPDFDYNVRAWLIDRWIIGVKINENPLGTKPYYKQSYVDQKGSFWGKGLPETIPDAQTLANQAGRSLQNNIGIASGPQVAFDEESLRPGQNTTKLWPWKIWRFIRNTFSSAKEPFIQFFQPALHAAELIGVYDKAKKIADEQCGVAGYAHGDPNVGGAGNTSSGFAMLLSQQNIGIQGVMEGFDRNVIVPSIEDLYYDNYELHDALDYIGDVSIVAKGTSWFTLKQQQALRLTEWLRTTANPFDMQIMGKEGRTYALKESARNMFSDATKLIPEKVTPIPLPGQGVVPTGGPTTLDQAGNPAQGVGTAIPQGG